VPPQSLLPQPPHTSSSSSSSPPPLQLSLTAARRHTSVSPQPPSSTASGHNSSPPPPHQPRSSVGGSTAAPAALQPPSSTAPSSVGGSPTTAVATVSTSTAAAAAAAPPRCCDTGRPIFTDPITGQTVCSCQYDLLSYQRLAASGVPALSMYTAPYPEGMAAYFPALGSDQPPFYSAVSTYLYYIKPQTDYSITLYTHHIGYRYSRICLWPHFAIGI